MEDAAPAEAAAAAPSAAIPGIDAAAVASAVKLAGGQCIRIFVAGAVTHVGKTTVCLSILAALRQAGLKPSELGYIKPATQCEAPDLLKHWCDAEGVQYVSGEEAPLVFYQGFTRSFLAGEQGTSTAWQEKIAAKVDAMAEGRRVLIIDGVGFPAVGSIVGVDNADVARACRAPVLIVCKCGVGAAVDSFSLNSCYFKAKGVPVLGALFNMGDLDGFNSWDKCAPNIKLWFSREVDRRERYYGTVPLSMSLNGLRERVKDFDAAALSRFAVLNAQHFATHVDLPGVLTDAALDPWCRVGRAPTSQPAATPSSAPGAGAVPMAAFTPAAQSVPVASFTPGAAAVPETFLPKTRSQVAVDAAKDGAKGGG